MINMKKNKTLNNYKIIDLTRIGADELAASGSAEAVLVICSHCEISMTRAKNDQLFCRVWPSQRRICHFKEAGGHRSMHSTEETRK